MGRRWQSRGWRIARRVFRWCRITLWLVILGLLVAALWLNHYGLPGFMKDRLVVALRERGMELQFTRMRLAWDRGVVADNIQFGRSGQPRGPRASAKEAEVHLRFVDLLRGRLDVKGVALRGGHVTLPIWGTNDQPRDLVLEKVNGELRFLPDDGWNLTGLTAESFGVELQLGGTVTHASEIRNWKFGQQKPDPKTAQAFWHDLIRQFEETRFQPPTRIVGNISGDALDLKTFRASLRVTSPSIDSPWGRGTHFNLTAQITPAPGELIHAEVRLQAQDADTRWGQAQNVQLEAQLTPSLTQWTPTNAHMDLELKRARTPWAGAATLVIKADFRPNPSDPASALAEYTIRGQQIQGKWARFAQAELSAAGVVSASNAWPISAKTKFQFAGGEIDAGRASSGTIEASLALPTFASLQLTNAAVSWWWRLDQVQGDVNAQLSDVHAPELELKSVKLKSSWHGPLLLMPELSAELYDGTLQGSARLDTATRRLSAQVKSDFDPQQAAPLLGTNARQWLAQFGWRQPPKLSTRLSVTLPVWTNQMGWRTTDWPGEVLPTLELEGDFQVGPVSYRSVPLRAAQSDFTYTNRVWRLPSVVLAAPEGKVYASHVAHEVTGEYSFVIDSRVDPRMIRPLLDPEVQKVIDEFTITSPPEIYAEISGRWSDLAHTSARATIAITNAGYRKQVALEARALITFTNQVLSIVDPVVVRPEGTGRADSVVLDFPRKRLFLNHANGSLDGRAVVTAVGPSVAELMEPYRFLQAPHGRVDGYVNLEDGSLSDLRFQLGGGPFEWRSFRFQQITGDVHWAGPSLTLSNLHGTMHGGELDASMKFDFTAKEGANFAFTTVVTNINLRSLIKDFGNATNTLEGTLDGRLIITKANTEVPRSWFGRGDASLKDGLIWEVPVFGLFSPVLNVIVPGSGNNRAKEAEATFIISNSVIRTDNLKIQASGMRLTYEGWIDFDTRLDGRMEAALFRDTPGVGPLVSTVFSPLTKLLEYKVTGTLNKPKSEPLYVPKIFMVPFHPLRSLRELMESGKEETAPAPFRLKPAE